MSSRDLQGCPTEQSQNAMLAGSAAVEMPISAAIAPCTVSPVAEQDDPNSCNPKAGWLYSQLKAERSLANIGELFHSPLSFLSATVICAS